MFTGCFTTFEEICQRRVESRRIVAHHAVRGVGDYDRLRNVFAFAHRCGHGGKVLAASLAVAFADIHQIAKVGRAEVERRVRSSDVGGFTQWAWSVGRAPAELKAAVL